MDDLLAQFQKETGITVVQQRMVPTDCWTVSWRMNDLVVPLPAG